MDYSVNLAGVRLEHPIMNAAGTVKYPNEVEAFAETAASAGVLGSITMEDRQGHSGETYFSGPGFSTNSIGLKNPGLPFFKQRGADLVALLHDKGKKVCFSLAGLKIGEFALLTELAIECAVDWAELNLGCPNVLDEGKVKPTFSVKPDLVAEILGLVDEHSFSDVPIPIFLKMSPLSDLEALWRNAQIISRYPWVSGVAAVNTFPDALYFKDSGRTAIDPNEGRGGYGGYGMLPIGLGQVALWRKYLPADRQVIGVGGLSKGEDAWMYLCAGATAVQTATTFLNEGPNVFSRLLREMVESEESAIARMVMADRKS